MESNEDLYISKNELCEIIEITNLTQYSVFISFIDKGKPIFNMIISPNMPPQSVPMEVYFYNRKPEMTYKVLNQTN